MHRRRRPSHSLLGPFLALLLLPAGPAGARAQLAEPPRAAPLAAPDTFWLDPALEDSSWVAGAGPEVRARVVVWFDRQLLATRDAYPEAARRWESAPRRALRAEVLAELQRVSRESWAAALPALRALEEDGLLAECRRLWIVNGFTCERPDRTRSLAALGGVPGVRLVLRAFPTGPPQRAEEAGPRHLAPTEAAWSPDSVPWHLEALSVPEVWRELGVTGAGVLNVVHDFGFRLDSPPVRSTLWVNPGEHPGNGVDDDGNGRVDDVHGFDFDAGDEAVNTGAPSIADHIHGNTVAGIIAGRSPVDSELQLGIAPDARWAPVVGLVRFEEALQWALDEGADTYTMSFSLPDLGALRAHWRKAFEHAALAGLFAVSGAGNFGDPARDNHVPEPRQMRIPEDIPLAVFGVAGLDREGARPPYSSRGPVLWDVVHYGEGYAPKPDLATVNADIAAADFEGRETGPVNGNSFAGPHLTGILALMLQADPDLTPWRARAILVRTARNMPPEGFDFATGHGQVDAAAAVRAVLADVDGREGRAGPEGPR